MANEKPVGKPYNIVFIERGTPTDDSERLRRRFAAFINACRHDLRAQVAFAMNSELGADTNALDIGNWFGSCTVPDLVSAVTHIYLSLGKLRWGDLQSKWLDFAQRAFKEENIAYTVDDECGVHPAHDPEFDASRRATIAMLGKPRYAAARQFFDKSIADLKQPRDTRDAVRKTFEALENVAKLMCPGDIARLTDTEVKKYLQPIALEGTNGTERNARGRMIVSLAEWVNACQQYRHAAGQPEPDAPSLDLAILLVSDGAAYPRWLITHDQASEGAGP
jgi:hypothetical protein